MVNSNPVNVIKATDAQFDKAMASLKGKRLTDKNVVAACKDAGIPEALAENIKFFAQMHRL